MTKNQHVASPRCWRLMRLAKVFALALSLGAGAAMATQSGLTGAESATSDAIADLIAQANSPAGVTDTEIAAVIAANTHQPHATMGSTLVVQNCNDSGFGSLRAAVAGAASGDIIDMSGLLCTINLDSVISVNVDSLSLQGHQVLELCGAPPVVVPCFRTYPTISGQYNARVIHHTGAGTLSLDTLDVRYGTWGSSGGGCIESHGNVDLDSTYVHHCNALNVGGAIAAIGNVSLNASTVRDSLVTGAGLVQGGGIYAGGDVILTSRSRVSRNEARASHGESYGEQAHGGGIWAGGLVTVSDSRIDDNVVDSAGQTTNPINEGAGIFASDSALIYDSEITDNSVLKGGSGAGIFVAGGQLVMNDSIVEGNSSAGSGGGIALYANLASYISSTSISDNSAQSSGALLFPYGLGGALIIRYSTIANNSQVKGASVLLLGTGDVLIRHTTISGNEASDDSTYGAGLYIHLADVTIKNSTITNNTGHNSSNEPHGAGISLNDGTASLTLSSSIVSGNQLGTSAADIGLAGSVTSASVAGDHNLIGWIDPAIPYPGDTIFNANPQLGPLADNGGPTLTHMPQLNSDAIGMGFANGYSDDQRGAGFLRTINGYTDIGSVQHDGDTIFFNGFE